MKYVIEDDFHAEPMNDPATYDEAIELLRELAAMPWNTGENVPPCGNPSCRRDYHLIEYDDTTTPHWTQLRSLPALTVSAAGVTWAPGFAPS